MNFDVMLGGALRETRIGLGLSIEIAASEAGISPAQMIDCEQGYFRLGSTAYYAILNLYGLPTSWLWSRLPADMIP